MRFPDRPKPVDNEMSKEAGAMIGWSSDSDQN
jgi:hypothetical protein